MSALSETQTTSDLPSAEQEDSRVDVRELVKSYRLGEDSIEVLKGLSLAVAAGEIVSIMGPSGSGKTTLLNCISGIDTPDEGEVRIAGNVVDYDSERARTNLRRHDIGMVFQFFNLVPTLMVRENVALPFLIARKANDDADGRVQTLLERVGIAGRADHRPYQLSGGEMQLASIARALAHQPAAILADEPTGNVNPAVGRSIMNTLRDVAKSEKTAVLLVTHSPEHAAWSDRVCFLKEGVIAAERTHDGDAENVRPIHETLLKLGI